MNEKSGKAFNDSDHLDRHLVFTDDGSTSLEIPGMSEMYHSRKGAIKESQHVYIEHGLHHADNKSIQILEIGMGTGLNVFLTYLDLVKSSGRTCCYHSLEPYPLNEQEWSKLNYHTLLNADGKLLEKIHSSAWDTEVELNEHFVLVKYRDWLENFEPAVLYDVIYFDAFAPNKQQNPWQLSNVQKCYDALNKGGVLVTYCSQGKFKRNLQAVGFNVTNPEGPMGKREITVAFK
ncbi:MAG: tRNA (5-methylaminomethyl-2-thiouridine)(34)-methyltransferase MnmD [Bacteroidia bacterium]|nr:tRNA (5-methylaminomethyl-2-thiouridine)(34)-methyltransferase MnmD [Bacteroidia bacterium]